MEDRREDNAEMMLRLAAEAGRRGLRLDVYHHFPDGLPIDLGAFSGSVNVNVTLPHPLPPPLPQATHAILTITQGATVPGQITVDTTNETATLQFLDDKGDTNAAAPDGAVVSFVSDNESVATVSADDPAQPYVAKVTPVAEGSANLSVSITDASGNPFTNPDGSAFPAVDSVAVTVGPGAAVAGSLSLSV